ncbi:hypothetical protein M2244_002729 [Rhodoferax antarcticus]|nr:hypothetical protein [Rhodoferax antarcticus]
MTAPWHGMARRAELTHVNAMRRVIFYARGLFVATP